MMIDPIRMIMYCNIPKVGSTVWKRAMAKLVSNMTEDKVAKMAKRHHQVDRNPTSFIHDDPAKFGIDTTELWTRNTLKIRERYYYKFVFVRDPFDRLKSTYRDKFMIHDHRTYKYYEGKIGKIIRQLYRPPNSRNLNLEITFEEFLRYTIATHKYNRGVDPHWMRFVERCDPCGIEYDFIGHMETLGEDAEYIFKEIFHSNLNVTKTLNPSYGPSATAHELIKPSLSSTYYDEVPDSVIQGIRDYLSVDAEMFGYDVNRQIQTES